MMNSLDRQIELIDKTIEMLKGIKESISIICDDYKSNQEQMLNKDNK